MRAHPHYVPLMRLPLRLPLRLLLVALLAAAFAGGWAGTALADHEPNHRYNVWGFMKDADGKPFPNEKVTVKHEKTGQTVIGVTGGDGRYQVKLHLHNDSLGDDLTVSVKGASKKATVKFDVADNTTERFGQVDLQVKERKAPAPLPPLYRRPSVLIGAGMGLAAVVGLILLTSQNRRKRNEEIKAERRQQAVKSKKKKRR